jgi:hypothetical protein
MLFRGSLMRHLTKLLAILALLLGAASGQSASAHGWGGGGWHGGGYWHGGGWGWGGWYPYWGYGWASPYLYASPYAYGTDVPPPPQPVGGLYCVTRVHLCALPAAMPPGARCACEGLRGRVSVLQGQ